MSEPPTPTTADVVVGYLGALGVRHVFGFPGTPNLDLIEVARRAGFELVLARREGTAAFMAQAYGMLSGLPGVCLSTLGPGSTSLVNGVANAFLDRAPMIAISGQVSSRREPCFTHQVVDHARLFAPVTKWTTRIVPEAAAQVMRKAIRIAMAERPGPVHISTNSDLVSAPAPDHEVVLPPTHSVRWWGEDDGAPGGAAAGGGGFTPNDVDAADPVRLLAGARRPIVLAGMSARRAGAREALGRFAERVGCPVVVSPMAKGVFSEDHALFAGVVDMACNHLVWDFLSRADLLVLVGFDAVELIKEWGLRARGIHVDSVPNTDQIYQAEVELVGPIPRILDRFAEGFRGEPRWSEDEIRVHRRALREAYYAGAVPGALNPTDVVDALNDGLPTDTVLTTDVGSHKLLIGQGWRPGRPDTFLMTNGLSSMGFALPAAIAAKLLRPSAPVVCTVGDGGFAMVQGELRLASELGLEIIVLVFCDDTLHRIEIKQRGRDYPSAMTRFGATDLVRLAESMDCHGARVETVTELQSVLRESRKGLHSPLVIEARIDPTQYAAQF